MQPRIDQITLIKCVKMCDKLKLLGVTVDNNLQDLEENFEDKLGDIKKLLARWKRRTLTLMGRITVW